MLKNDKSPGYDGVLNEFIKKSLPKMGDALAGLFNIVLNSGHIPEEWAIGLIVPIYKNKGDIRNPDNYRGITLLSCIGKLFTSILNYRLSEFLDESGALGEEQAGFRSGYSTQDHVFTLKMLIDLYNSHNKRLYCAFIDYKKAFDSIHRSYLWQKIIGEGISGKCLTVIYNLYDKAKPKIKLNGKISSSTFTCNRGVRQGENLSPLLFALFLNDLQQFLSSKYGGLTKLSGCINDNLSNDDIEVFLRLFILMYADDTLIFAESIHDLQLALDSMFEYCSIWGLSVNPVKTKVVIFSKGKIRNKPDFRYNDELLEVVDNFVYLGVNFSSNGSFKKGQVYATDRSNKSIFSAICKSRQLNLSLDIQIDLYDKLVAPVALYGCEVWGPFGHDILSRVQLRYYKYVLRLKKSTNTAMLLGELGKLPMCDTIKSRVLNFWFKIVTGQNDRKLCKIMYNLMLNIFKKNVGIASRWIKYVKQSLDELGLSFIWLTQSTLTSDMSHWLKKTVDACIKDQFISNWQSKLRDTDNCVIYRLFKTNFCSEEYIRKLPICLGITMFKFRCRNSKFPAVLHVQNALENPMYSLCNDNDRADEFHLLLKCSYFREERKKLLGKYAFTFANVHTLASIMNTKNCARLTDLSRFIRIIMSCHR